MKGLIPKYDIHTKRKPGRPQGSVGVRSSLISHATTEEQNKVIRKFIDAAIKDNADMSDVREFLSYLFVKPRDTPIRIEDISDLSDAQRNNGELLNRIIRDHMLLGKISPNEATALLDVVERTLVNQELYDTRTQIALAA
jgi:hypothetical protein